MERNLLNNSLAMQLGVAYLVDYRHRIIFSES
jgi:hypothetical protein